jgi:hypothetical protein
MVPIIMNPAAKTFKILLGNDGGVFVSKVSANPGTLEGDWQFKGIGYNTSQFYGADKKPGKDQYIGGMQDNGTRMSPSSEDASAETSYLYAIGGDGFEVLWNSKDEDKILGSVYYAQISRTENGGTTWESAGSGLDANEIDFPFVTKLANSKDFPDRVFTVGGKGVYVSNDFGKNWTLTPIDENFILGSSFYLDVEVSRANADIVWAGSGMTNSGPLVRSLHVSTDGGASFSPTVNFPVVALGNITKIATHPTEQNTAYAIFSFSKNPKILRTTNLGQSWEDISGFGNGTSSINGFPDVAVYCLYVRPDNPDIIWAGTEIGIVESMDNGGSWSLIEDFPNVSVWDMKGQDKQVVIATHGRGIWTAQLEAEQASRETAAIVAAGTSPTGDFVCRIESKESFDSIQVFLENNLAKTFYTIKPGTFDVQLKNVSTGNRSLRLISYKGTIPLQSQDYIGTQISVLAKKNSYATYFNTLSDLHVNGLTLQHFVGGSSQRQTLHTNHNYSLNRSYEILLRTPVVVSGSLPILYYRDIAIIEPGNDSVIVEATRNGLDWISLAPGYDATFHGDQTGSWENAFRNNRAGKAEMFIKHEINLQETFEARDLLLFRFRFVSGGAITSWGWAIDYISVQETPIIPDHSDVQLSLAIFPNPSPGGITVDYTLEQPSEITFVLVDVYGRHVLSLVAGERKTGYNSEVLDLNSVHPGTYILILNSTEGKKTGKLTLTR